MDKRYHFIGIGGIGMGTLASLMLSKGYRVTGSDLHANAMTESLIKQGATISIGHKSDNVVGADIVVFSSAVKEDNPELNEADKQNIPCLPRAQLLAQMMRDHIGITIAGSHGKTTTTSMVANMLIKADLEPTVALGGVLKGGGYEAPLGQGKYFVAEVDESDGSFLFFHPQFSIITNIDLEHLDYYRDWEHISETFTRFISHTDPKGKLIICGDDKNLWPLVEHSHRSFMSYGFSEIYDVYARNVRDQGYTTKFDYIVKGEHEGTLQLLIPGRHNVLNALACVCLGKCLGISYAVLEEAFMFFQGVQRRFQLKGRVDDIVLVDDYGHHPTEIAATLDTARSLKKKRVITVFQPHRYTRTKYLKDELVAALSNCDHLIITDIYAASEPPIAGVSAQSLCDAFPRNQGKVVEYVPRHEIMPHLVKIVSSGDLVLTLGAGDIYQIGEEFFNVLSNQAINTPLAKEDV